MIHTVEIHTVVTLTVDVEADSRADAVDRVLNGDALPRWPVSVTTDPACPPGAYAQLDNKGWEASGEDEEI